MSVLPPETNSKLVIDSNTMLTCAIAAQRLEAIAWGTGQVLQCRGDLNLFQLAQGYSLEGPKLVDSLPLEQCLGVAIRKRTNHQVILLSIT
jgi:hypothetical protein